MWQLLEQRTDGLEIAFERCKSKFKNKVYVKGNSLSSLFY